MSIVKEIKYWWRCEVMPHSIWEGWDSSDFYSAFKVIIKYEQKLNTLLKDKGIPPPENLTTKFAMWFSVNWEFYDDTDKGQTYRSIYDGKTILPIGEIYDNWLLNDV